MTSRIAAITKEIKKESEPVKIFTFLNNSDLSSFLNEVNSLDLMEFSSPELLLRNLAKVFQEGADLNSTHKFIEGFKIYAQAMEDTSLFIEIEKPPGLINWWKIESYFDTLSDVLDEPLEASIKPYFAYRQMDMRRFVSQNKGRSDLSEATGRQYSRREKMSDVIQGVIFEELPFDTIVSINEKDTPLLSVVSSIISGNTDEGGGVSERDSLSYIKKNHPHAYEYLNSVFDLESFCCGQVDEKIFSKRKKITPLETSSVDMNGLSGIKKQ